MFRILRDAFGEWRKDNAVLLAGALAYHAVFALAPLLLLVIAVAALILNEQSAQTAVVEWMRGAAGEEAARFVVTALQAREWIGDSVTATLISLGIILIAALGLLGTLRVCLNTVWQIEPRPSGSWIDLIIKRIGTLLLVLIAGGLLLLSTIASAVMTGFLDIVSGYVQMPPFTLGFLQFVLFFLISSLLFLSIFKSLPDARIAWRDASIGALFTGALFVLGATVLTRYLSWTGAASAYGAASSVIALLLWIYYTAQILLFGAECTKVFAASHGARIEPDASARRAEKGTHIEIVRLSWLQKSHVVVKTLLVEWKIARFFLWIRRTLRRDHSDDRE